MIAAIDNTFLTLLLNPAAVATPNPATGQPIPHCKQRIEALVDDLSRQNGTLLIPTPALAEALCVSEAAEAYVEALQQYSAVELAAFDGKAAYELGRVVREARANGDKRSGQGGTWQHVKMDRTIVAIAVSRSVDCFYSDDERQKEFARLAGLEVKSTWDLALPAQYAQHHLAEQAPEQWGPQRKPVGSSDSETQSPG